MSMRELVLSVVCDFRQTWRRLLVIDLLYKLAEFVALWPLVGLALRGFVATTGSSAVADQDILFAVLSPIGLSAVIVVAALGVAVVALEQACLMTIGFGAARNVRVRAADALVYGMRFAVPVLRLSLRAVVQAIILSAPFLAIAGGIYWGLLSEFDINFYLANRPPAFWIAAILAGIDLVVMAAVLVPRLLSWAYALPLVQFEGISPRHALRMSAERTAGHRGQLAVALAGWAIVATVLPTVNVGVVVLLGRTMRPLVKDSITLIVPVIGGLVLLWVIGNVFVTMIQAATFALVTTRLYDRLGNSANARLDERVLAARTQNRERRHVTLRTLFLGLAAAAVAAALLGTWLLRGVRFEDNVTVIAHRGGARASPENTMAAFRRAIQDGADQVELDVQETADGEVVVIHDSDLMKIAGVDLKIWNAAREQLDAIDIGSHFSADFSNERVPRLADVLEQCKGKVTVNIELKYYGHDQQLEQRVADLVESAGMESQIVVMSLEYPAVQKMKKLRPQWTVGLLSATAIGDLTKLDSDFLAVNMGMASRGFIRRAHGHGKLVYVWTVNDPVQLSHMISMGVDGVITDDARLAASVLARRSQMSSVERLLVTLAFWIVTVPRDADSTVQ